MIFEHRPSLMVSYVFLDSFQKARHKWEIRDWALDSGAFSAWTSGVEVNLNQYIDDCLRMQEEDKELIEIFSLDVIGRSGTKHSRAKAAELSLKNAEKMWEAGVEAIPTYHMGEPEEFLLHIAKEYPKIALGGMVGTSIAVRDNFMKECFARIWPKKVHGFGECYRDALLSFPFHSADAANWKRDPCGWGRWRSFGNKKLSIMGSNQNLRAEIEFYLKIEREAQRRWKKEMKLLGEEKGKARPDIKLSVMVTNQETRALAPKTKTRRRKK